MEEVHKDDVGRIRNPLADRLKGDLSGERTTETLINDLPTPGNRGETEWVRSGYGGETERVYRTLGEHLQEDRSDLTES